MAKMQIIIFISLFVTGQAVAQVGLMVDKEPWRIGEAEKSIVGSEGITKMVVKDFGATESRVLELKTPGLPNTSFDTGWFCKLDANMDLKLPYKLRFRLGEYHYTRKLEYGEEY